MVKELKLKTISLMTKVKNTSFTLFRFQEYIWRPDEVLIFNENGMAAWEDRLAYQLTSQYKNLVIVSDKKSPEELKQFRIENLKKARAARKEKSE